MSARVILKMHQSLDGFVCTPSGDNSWIFSQLDDHILAWEVNHLWQAGVHIMGRNLYHDMAAYWPGSTEPPAAPMNEIPKVVFSKTLSSTPWGETRIADGNLVDEISRLRQLYTKDIFAHGGASFAQALAEADLIDEYRLIIHPVMLGQGKPVTTTPRQLRLRSSLTFSTGAVALVYSRK